MNTLIARIRRDRTRFILLCITLVVAGGLFGLVSALSNPTVTNAQTITICDRFPENRGSCEGGVKAGFKGTSQAAACPVVQVPNAGGSGTSNAASPSRQACIAGWINGNEQRKKASENKNDSAGWCEKRFPKSITACKKGYDDGYAGKKQSTACPTSGSNKLSGESLQSCNAGQIEGAKRRDAAGLNEPKAPASDLERLAIKACKEDYGETGHAAGVCKRAFLRAFAPAAELPANAAAACTQASNDEDKAACVKGFELGNIQKRGGQEAVDAQDAAAAAAESPDRCRAGSNPIKMVVCPFVDGVVETVDKLDLAINELLTVNTATIFCTKTIPDECTLNDTTSGKAYYKAWDSFRKIGLGIIFIVALLIIIASAFGYDILDAYTIRKTLPRVLIAIVFITLSWSILQFLINFTNDIGNGLRWIIYEPFDGMETPQVGGAAAGIGSAVLAGFLFGYGILAVLSFGLTALLAVLIAFGILVLRELIIVFLVIMAPIAIACLIFPNTRKMWQLWQNTLTTMLIAFPLIIAIIATGRVFSNTVYVSNPDNGITQMIAFLAWLIPYFMLPFAFRLAGGMIGTLAGLANDRGRGAFDRLKKYRGGQLDKNMHNARNFKRFNERTRFGRGLNNATGALANADQSIKGNPLKTRNRMASLRGSAQSMNAAAQLKDNAVWNNNQGNDAFLAAVADRGFAHKQLKKAEAGGDQREIDNWRNAIGQAESLGASGKSRGVRTQALSALSKTGYQFSYGKEGYDEMSAMAESIAGGKNGFYTTMMDEAQYNARGAGRADLGDINHGSGYNPGGALDKLDPYTMATRAKPQTIRARGQQMRDAISSAQTASRAAATARASGDMSKYNEEMAKYSDNMTKASVIRHELNNGWESATGKNKDEFQKQMKFTADTSAGESQADFNDLNVKLESWDKAVVKADGQTVRVNHTAGATGWSPAEEARGWRMETRDVRNTDLTRGQARGGRRPNPSELDP